MVLRQIVLGNWLSLFSWAEEMVQLIRCLPHRLEDLSLDAQHPGKKPGLVMCAVTHSLWRRSRQVLGAHWLTNLAELIRSGSGRDYVNMGEMD